MFALKRTSIGNLWTTLKGVGGLDSDKTWPARERDKILEILRSSLILPLT